MNKLDYFNSWNNPHCCLLFEYLCF